MAKFIEQECSSSAAKKFNPLSRNFMLTKNNPTETLEDFMGKLKVNARYARVQLEKGKEGTLHFQACVGYEKIKRSLVKMRKEFPGCHIEVTRCALDAWNYCGKEDTRVEGPLEYGIPPAALNK